MAASYSYKKNKKGKVLHSQAKQIIFNIYGKLVEQNPDKTISHIVDLVSDLTGVSVATVYRIRKGLMKEGTQSIPKSVKRNVVNAMESLVDEQGSTLHIGDRALSSPTLLDGDRDSLPVSSSGSQVRSNILFTKPSQVNQVQKVVGSGGSTAQTIALPQPDGAISIVHVTLPNQPVHAQSVIQPGPNQQSVIQTAGGNALQSMQLPKNVVLLNKVTQGSVIDSTDNEAEVYPVQLISASNDDDDDEIITLDLSDDESKKNREILARQPSYCKILNDLSSTEAQGAVVSLTGNSGTTVKEEAGNANGGNDATNQESERGIVNENTIIVAGTQYNTASDILKVLPASAIQLVSQDGSIQGFQTIAMANSESGTTGTIVQYAQDQDGQFFVPVTVSAADLQAYQMTTHSTGSESLTHGVAKAPSCNLNQQHTVVEDASRKRELCLLKNRESAKECRRKKKEYIKCLENHVAVLENQNKTLIEELKSLKELYCQKTE